MSGTLVRGLHSPLLCASRRGCPRVPARLTGAWRLEGHITAGSRPSGLGAPVVQAAQTSQVVLPRPGESGDVFGDGFGDYTDLEAALAAAVADAPAAGQQRETQVPQFDWYKQWYPLAILEDLDPTIPRAAQLLGKDLVLWKDKSGTWRCFEDRCPHRLAALSEGRIDDKTGDLYCNYHGWAFEGTGKCTSIPQLKPEDSAKRQSKRACAITYPTREAEGLLWVWANSGPNADLEAATAPWRGLAGAIAEHGDAAHSGHGRWFLRDFPGSYIATKENSWNDPSHDTVLHHGIPGLLRDNAAPLETELVEMTPTGYKIKHTRPGGIVSVDTSAFPVGNSRLTPWFEGIAYTVPAAPGRVLLFVAFLPAGKPRARKAFDFSAITRPRWMSHLGTHKLLDADNVIQWSVSRQRAKGGKVYLPAEADRGPAATWAWLQKYGGGGPPGHTLQQPIDLSQPEVPRRVLLDRFEQHTKICKDCSHAHATATYLASAAKLLAAALSVAAIAFLAARGAVPLAGALAAVAALAAALAARLHSLVQEFVFVDYDKNHASKKP